jgi:hypothetical protein
MTSSSLGWFIQDPDAVLNYAVNWSLDDGDTIASSTWTPATGINVEADSFTNMPAPQAVARISFPAGTTPGGPYKVVNHITTTQGLAGDKTLIITCQEE